MKKVKNNQIQRQDENRNCNAAQNKKQEQEQRIKIELTNTDIAWDIGETLGDEKKERIRICVSRSCCGFVLLFARDVFECTLLNDLLFFAFLVFFASHLFFKRKSEAKRREEKKKSEEEK